MAKRSNKIEPLDIDEMFNSPSLEGMLSFRDVEPAAAVDRLRARTTLDTVDSNAGSTTGVVPARLIPIGLAPIVPAITEELETEAFQSTPITPASDEGLTTADVLAELKGTPQHQPTRGKLIRALKVEDGHSNNENSLYWYLWRSGRHIKDSRSRFLQAGYAQLSKAIGVDRTNVQNMLRFLESKLSIRIVTPGTVRSATVYEVYSCEQILVRRRESGLLWVRRFGSRRVDFVQESGEALLPGGSRAPIVDLRAGTMGSQGNAVPGDNA